MRFKKDNNAKINNKQQEYKRYRFVAKSIKVLKMPSR